jgi:hypothetical protein
MEKVQKPSNSENSVAVKPSKGGWIDGASGCQVLVI